MSDPSSPPGSPERAAPSPLPENAEPGNDIDQSFRDEGVDRVGEDRDPYQELIEIVKAITDDADEDDATETAKVVAIRIKEECHTVEMLT